MQSRIIFFLASCSVFHKAVSTYTYIAGYEPGTDVVEHSEIDLDVKQLITDLPNANGGDLLDCADDKCKWSSGNGGVAFAMGGALGAPAGNSVTFYDGGCTAGSTTITLSSTTGLVPNMLVTTNCGVKSGSTITTVNANVDIVVSNSATISLSGAIISGETVANRDANTAVRDLWQFGRYSSSSRSAKGFATGAETKASSNGDKDVAYRNNPFIQVMNNYWESKGLNRYTWGQDIIQAAIDGSTIPGATGNAFDFSLQGFDFRREVIQKGVVYLNIFPYVIWEMQDAINDCNAGDQNANGDQVHAWDEAVAFYTGSLEGASQGGNNGLGSCSDGDCELQFMLADKRCMNYGTCTADYDKNPYAGYSELNSLIFKEFNEGKEQLNSAVGSTSSIACSDVTSTMNRISGLMLVPFTQGVIRYLYKTRSSQKAKEAGELFAFASALLPFVDLVDKNVGEMLYKRAWGLDFTTYTDVNIKDGIESTYSAMGVGAGVGQVTCARVGGLVGSSQEVYYAPCTDASTGSSDEDNSALTVGLGVGLGLGIPLLIVTTLAVYYFSKYLDTYQKLDEYSGVSLSDQAAQDPSTLTNV